VRVRGRFGWRDSKLRRIRLVQAAAFAKPEFIQPLDGDFVLVGSTATFEWMPVEGATSYHVQATDCAAFDRLTLDTVVTETFVMKRLAQDAPFLQWRVQPRSERGMGPWSDTAYVTLRGAEQIKLLPRSPKFGARGVPTSGALTVGNVGNTTKLAAQLGTDPYFDEGAIVVDIQDSVGLYVGLAANSRHYWRPVAVGPDTLRTYGATSVFVTDRTSSTHDPADEAPITVRFVRRTGTLHLSEPSVGPATLLLYSLDGRLLFQRLVSTGEHVIDLPYESHWPILLVVELLNHASCPPTRQVIFCW
jgi:hypothetical protein